VDYLGREFLQDPYPGFRELLAAPGFHKMGGIWFIVRHRDCAFFMKHPDIGRELEGLPAAEPDRETHPLFFTLRHIFAMRDPPNHTRIRNALSPPFTPKEINGLTQMIEHTAAALLDRLDARPADLMSQFAVPLPFKVIATLIGIPPEYHERLIGWVHDFRKGLEEVLPPIRRELHTRANRAAQEVYDLIARECRQRESHPRDDWLSRFVPRLRDGTIDFDELVCGTILMLPAGTQTTLQTIGNASCALLRHPEQLRLFRTMPADALDAAVEELLRFESPVKCLMRLVKKDIEYQGRRFRRGEQVCIFYAAANRDPAVFRQPEELDLARNGNRHIAFGGGPHHCLGLHLGRLETKIALRALFGRFPGLALRDPNLEWEDSFFSRQLLALPVTLNS
jgi:cytochrome P450 StaP